jgi:hypothetical protein
MWPSSQNPIHNKFASMDQQIMPGTFGLRRTNFGSRTESRAGEWLWAHNLLQINESVKTLIEGDQQIFIYRRWFMLQKVPEASIISNKQHLQQQDLFIVSSPSEKLLLSVKVFKDPSSYCYTLSSLALRVGLRAGHAGFGPLIDSTRKCIGRTR